MRCWALIHRRCYELVTPDAFDEYMSHRTAQAVFDVYADVQERFYKRRISADKTAIDTGTA